MTLLVVVRCDGCGKETPSRAEREDAYTDAVREGWRVAHGCIGDDKCPSCIEEVQK